MEIPAKMAAGMSRRGFIRTGGSAVLGLALAGTAACGSADNGSSGNNDSHQAGQGRAKKVTVSHAYWAVAMTDVLKDLINKFEAQHPGITIDAQLTPFDQYFTKLQTAATGHNAPDVVLMNGVYIGQYALGSQLLALDPLLAADKLDTSAFSKASTDLYTWNDKLYGLPINNATVALFYNKKIFAKGGVQPPDENWDWGAMKTAAAKLTDKDNGIYGFASPLTNQSGYYNTIPQAGGYVLSDDRKRSGYDDPKSIAGLQFLLDFVRSGSSPSYEQLTATQASDMFISGKIAMMYGIPAQAWQFSQSGQIKPNTGIAILPKGPDKRATVAHSTANCITAGSKHQQEAWEWVKFLSSKDAQAQFGKTGSLLPAIDGSQDLYYQSMPDLNAKAFVDEYPYSVPFPASKNSGAWQALETKYLAPVWAGKADLETACKQLASGMNQELANE